MEIKTYSAVKAKRYFGWIIEETQNIPVQITKYNRDVVVMLSNQKLYDIAENFLGKYFLEQVKMGKMNVLAAIEEQIQVVKQSEIANLALKNGECYEATDEFFANIKKIAVNLNS